MAHLTTDRSLSHIRNHPRKLLTEPQMISQKINLSKQPQIFLGTINVSLKLFREPKVDQQTITDSRNQGLQMVH